LNVDNRKCRNETELRDVFTLNLQVLIHI